MCALPSLFQAGAGALAGAVTADVAGVSTACGSPGVPLACASVDMDTSRTTSAPFQLFFTSSSFPAAWPVPSINSCGKDRGANLREYLQESEEMFKSVLMRGLRFDKLRFTQAS
jgi:hypothetical protein